MSTPPPKPERPPIFIPGAPGHTPAAWSLDHGCPRCKSAKVEVDAVRPRFLLLSALAPATCGACGFHFSTHTGRSVTPVIVAAYVVPLLLAVVFALVVLLR